MWSQIHCFKDQYLLPSSWWFWPMSASWAHITIWLLLPNPTSLSLSLFLTPKNALHMKWQLNISSKKPKPQGTFSTQRKSWNIVMAVFLSHALKKKGGEGDQFTHYATYLFVRKENVKSQFLMRKSMDTDISVMKAGNFYLSLGAVS